jgi:succinate-semialdehyde dehydrogenase/glutarate-semialdehyde dehydrogenase
MRDVADHFVDGLVEGAKALRVGDPLSFDTEVGPMVSVDQYEVVSELVEDALANGATLHCGGPVEPPGFSGKFYAPAVLTGVTHDMRIMREEIFGPVVPVVTVDSEEEAVALANDSEFGLGASIWSLDRDRAARIGRRLETGMVWLNDHMYSHGACQCAWGGAKHSGLGRAHSKFGFYECVNIKQMVWEPSRTRDFWWHPYDESLAGSMRAAAKLLYGRDADKWPALRAGAVPFTKLAAKMLRR